MTNAFACSMARTERRAEEDSGGDMTTFVTQRNHFGVCTMVSDEGEIKLHLKRGGRMGHGFIQTNRVFWPAVRAWDEGRQADPTGHVLMTQCEGFDGDTNLSLTVLADDIAKVAPVEDNDAKMIVEAVERSNTRLQFFLDDGEYKQNEGEAGDAASVARRRLCAGDDGAGGDHGEVPLARRRQQRRRRIMAARAASYSMGRCWWVRGYFKLKRAVLVDQVQMSLLIGAEGLLYSERDDEMFDLVVMGFIRRLLRRGGREKVDGRLKAKANDWMWRNFRRLLRCGAEGRLRRLRHLQEVMGDGEGHRQYVAALVRATDGRKPSDDDGAMTAQASLCLRRLMRDIASVDEMEEGRGFLDACL